MTVDHLGKPLPKPKAQPASVVKQTIASIHGFIQKQFDLSELRPGRFETVELFASNDASKSITTGSSTELCTYKFIMFSPMFNGSFNLISLTVTFLF